MTAPDQRVANAREYLDAIRPHKVTTRPPSVLLRECAELRRQLGQVLDVIGEQPQVLTASQMAGVLKALAVAADLTEDRASVYCDGCGTSPAGACDTHADMLDDAAQFRQLERDLTGHAATPRAYAAVHRVLCAHADADGQGAHWLEPGQTCTASTPAGGAR